MTCGYATIIIAIINGDERLSFKCGNVSLVAFSGLAGLEASALGSHNKETKQISAAAQRWT